MSRDLPLIHLLADGRFHSGQVLGEALGISRAAVWKRLESLTDLGVDIERVRGKGYRVPGGLSLLSADTIMSLMGEHSQLLSLDVKAETGSTNVDALYLARDALPVPAAILAEFQSSGRGRRGRVWHAPFASGLVLSFACEFPGGASRLEGLSLAVGVCLAELLRCRGAQNVALKWPNDVLVGRRKIAGILIELAGDLDASCRAIIGVGINVALPASLQVGQPVTDLRSELGERQDRNQLAADVLLALMAMAKQFSKDGFSAFYNRWLDFDAALGQQVDVIQSSGKLSGVARGVSPRGALLLETEAGMKELHGGEISLRLK